MHPLARILHLEGSKTNGCGALAAFEVKYPGWNIWVAHPAAHELTAIHRPTTIDDPQGNAPSLLEPAPAK